MLTGSSEAESMSLADKTVTGASSQEMISFEKLRSMDESDAKRMLPALKIITGEADKEWLLSLAGKLRYTVGITVSTYEDSENCTEADVLYASSSSGETAKEAADAVLSDGIMSLFRYGTYSRFIKRSTAVYTAARYILMLLSAVMMSAVSCGTLGFGMWYCAAAVNILLTALLIFILAGSGRVQAKNERILEQIKEKNS